jgi:hypothetical protein
MIARKKMMEVGMVEIIYQGKREQEYHEVMCGT